MRRCLFTIGLVCMMIPAIAQNWRQADSLRKALSKSNTDTGRVNTLLRLAEFGIFKPGEFKKDLDSAAVYLEQAKNLNKKINSTEIAGHIFLTESHLFKERGQKEQGKALVEKAICVLSKSTDKYQLGQAYLSLSEYYDPDNMAELRKALDAIAIAANSFKSAGSIEREAYAYKMLGDLDTGIDASVRYIKRSLELYKSIQYKNLQGLYDLLAAAYIGKLDFKQALANDLTALKIAGDVHDTTMQLCEINNHIGIIYYKLREMEESIRYLKAALKIAEAHSDVEAIYLTTSNICSCYNYLNRPQDILNILQYTVKKYPGWEKSAVRALLFTGNFLDAHRKLKQYGQAELYSESLINIINHNQIEKRDISDAYAKLIDYFFDSKQYSRELNYLKKNDTLAQQIGIATNFEVNNLNWFKLDTAQHNYKAAVYHLLIHQKIHDSTYTATKNKQVKQLQVEYQTKEKENQINILNQKTALQQSNLKQANLVKNVTIGGIILVIIIAGLLYRQSRLRKKNNKLITHQNELITHKNDLLQNLVTEKEWLLKEVHHRVKNNLHSVICLLEAQAAYLENDALQAIANSQHRIYTMSLIHQKLYQSDDVKTIDMSIYIPELIQYLRDSFDDTSRIHFQLTIEPIQLNASQAIPLALIINEALTNSIKYAFPNGRKGEIMISLTDTSSGYKMEIADNGIGLDRKMMAGGKGSLGLELMKGLTKEIGGKISFENYNGVKINVIFEQDALHNIDQLQIDYLAMAPAQGVH